MHGTRPDLLHGGGERRDRRPVEKVAEAHLREQQVLDGGEHPHRRQRIAAELEEVIIGAYLGHPDELAPDAGDRRLEPRSPGALGVAGPRYLPHIAHSRDGIDQV